MKNYLLLAILFLSVSTYAQKTEDVKSIKAMCGCYEIKFNFAETFNYPKDSANYKASKVKHENALEWAQLIEDGSDKISIQHLLIVGKGHIVKHWRQDWLFENTKLYDYNGFENWKFKSLPKDKVKGQWTQKVYEVDDKPRYEGSSSWIHADGRHYWENTTNAPLPRREYTQRSDYNITKRTNVHEIIKDGWIHDQDNDKIIRDEKGNDYVLAQEKGHNTYTKVDDSKCEAAQKWWVANQEFWKKVRTKWNAEFAKNKDIKLKSDIDGKPLYMHLSKLKADASQEEINTVIDSFIVSK
ncbi:hypothetical protein B0I03_104169 [Flavobacterium aquaticum]|uniref:Uncharacterized protein n=1 Tax=Flavobacterium aquaticum TaxID=1236486 RepID=A0A327YNU6_9FLAO|nr:DUF6607 family protein [Flavobacterium aquaticum]RAK22643.1 hypothetical protein B0I03_104169 [Flavobacterium aquaticum]